MVERADQQQVIEVRSATMSPPRDVVGLRERLRAASGETASTIPVADLTDHPRRGLAGHTAEAEHAARLILDHDLHPSVAHQTSDGLWVDSGAILDLAAAGVARQRVQLRVNDHRRPVLVGILRDAGGAEGDERVGAAR